MAYIECPDLLIFFSAFNGDRFDGIAIVVIPYENIFVATAGGDRETAGKVHCCSAGSLRDDGVTQIGCVMCGSWKNIVINCGARC